MSKRCSTKGCLNNAQKHRRICSKCKARQFAIKNPLSFTFNKLKWNAKRRGIFFGLTIDDWRDFCNRTSYLNFRGVMPESFTVDRINPNGGYIVENIQVLTMSANVRKSKRDRVKVLLNRPFPTKEQAGTPF